MSKLKVNSEELGRTLSDFLLWEATPLTRVSVAAPVGTKIGAFVDYPARSSKLIALSNEEGGYVMVQPHNCVIDLQFASDVPEDAKEQGDSFGIVYQNIPQATEAV